MGINDKIGKQCRVCVITSGKGGAGKSTVACGIGYALALQKKRVLLIDADEGLSCLDLMLGVAENVIYDLGDLVLGNCTISQATYSIIADGLLDVIPAPKHLGSLTEDRLKQVIEAAKDNYDFIFIDSTAGIGEGFNACVASVSEVIAVVNPDPVCIRDANCVSSLLADKNIKSCRMIINKFDYRTIKKGVSPDIDMIIDNAAFQLIGIVPNDVALPVFTAKGKLITKGRAAKAFARISRRILGENLPLPRLKKI